MTFLTSVLSYYKTRIVSSLKTWISSRECYNQKDEWILRLMNGYVMVRAVHKVQTFTALDSPLIPSSFSCSLIIYQQISLVLTELNSYYADITIKNSIRKMDWNWRWRTSWKWSILLMSLISYWFRQLTIIPEKESDVIDKDRRVDRWNVHNIWRSHWKVDRVLANQDVNSTASLLTSNISFAWFLSDEM